MAAQKHVMVVNDYPEFLELMVELLQDEGYAVTVLAKHQGAFQEIKKIRPDVVVCDLVFGNEMAGFGLLDMLHLDPETRTIPLILCTAATEKVREIAPSLSAKGIQWLEKPFTIEALAALLTKVLGGKADSSAKGA
jgi:CheY-like chemotaxis protein